MTGEILNVTLVGKDELTAHFDDMPDAVRQSVKNEIDGLAREIENYIKFDKLQGQVLNKITGALQGSIHSEVTEQADLIQGRDFSDTSVDYAAAHEYGFSGMQTVRQHMRSSLFGREVTPFSVGPFQRMMNIPERSFMRSSLADWQQEIIQRMTDAATRGAAQNA